MTHMELLVGRDAKTYCCVAKRRRRRQARKVVERIDAAAELLSQGCITTATLMQELDINHSEAYYVLQLLRQQGRAVEAIVGKVALWCRDRETAEELIRRLRETVRRLATENGIRYATPSKILQAALKDREAYELLRAFVPLRYTATFHPVALAFVRDVLHQLYGEPLRYSNSKYVYIVRDEVETT